MTRWDYDVVIIGGGAAGLTASIWSAQLKQRTLLIEKEPRLGGDCLHYGCVPSKTLLKTAAVRWMIRRCDEYGLPTLSLPAVDFKRVKQRIQSVIAHIQKNDSPEFLKQNYGIETLFGAARFIDPHTIQIQDHRVTAKKVIIATGSSPRVPPINGLDQIAYLTNMNVFSLDRLPETLAVVGAGPIGVEMAQAFQRLGSRVTVIEPLDCILPKEDPDVSCYVHERLQSEGITFITKAYAQSVTRSSQGIALTVQIKDGETFSLQTEALLIATGRVPNIHELSLDNAGVNAAPNGIIVNDRLQTSQSHIYAIGDCRQGYQFTHVAEYEARLAALNARLPWPLFKRDLRGVGWCTYTDPEVASFGLNETMARQRGLTFEVHRYEFEHIDRALAEGNTAGFIKVLTDKKQRVLGVQIIGPHAGEIIHEWLPLITHRLPAGSIEKAIHIYPTLAQINKKAAGVILSKAGPWTKIKTYLFG